MFAHSPLSFFCPFFIYVFVFSQILWQTLANSLMQWMVPEFSRHCVKKVFFFVFAPLKKNYKKESQTEWKEKFRGEGRELKILLHRFKNPKVFELPKFTSSKRSNQNPPIKKSVTFLFLCLELGTFFAHFFPFPYIIFFKIKKKTP